MNRVLSAAVAAALAVAAPAVLAETAEATSEAPIVVAAAPAGDTAGTPRAAPERRAFRGASERVEARLLYQDGVRTGSAKSAGERFASVCVA